MQCANADYEYPSEWNPEALGPTDKARAMSIVATLGCYASQVMHNFTWVPSQTTKDSMRAIIQTTGSGDQTGRANFVLGEIKREGEKTVENAHRWAGPVLKRVLDVPLWKTAPDGMVPDISDTIRSKMWAFYCTETDSISFVSAVSPKILRSMVDELRSELGEMDVQNFNRMLKDEIVLGLRNLVRIFNDFETGLDPGLIRGIVARLRKIGLSSLPNEDIQGLRNAYMRDWVNRSARLQVLDPHSTLLEKQRLGDVEFDVVGAKLASAMSHYPGVGGVDEAYRCANPVTAREFGKTHNYGIHIFPSETTEFKNRNLIGLVRTAKNEFEPVCVSTEETDAALLESLGIHSWTPFAATISTYPKLTPLVTSLTSLVAVRKSATLPNPHAALYCMTLSAMLPNLRYYYGLSTRVAIQLEKHTEFQEWMKFAEEQGLLSIMRSNEEGYQRFMRRVQSDRDNSRVISAYGRVNS